MFFASVSFQEEKGMQIKTIAKFVSIACAISIICTIVFFILWITEKRINPKFKIGDRVQLAEIFCKEGYDDYRGVYSIIAFKYTKDEIYACLSNGKEINVKCLISKKRKK